MYFVSFAYPLTAVPQTHQLIIPTNLLDTYFIHVHNDDWILNGDIQYTIKFPSQLDLRRLSQKMQLNAQTLNVPPVETGLITITSQGIYAISLLEPAPIVAGTVNWSASILWQDFEDEYLKIAIKLVGECEMDPYNNAITAQKLEPLIMRLLKKYKLYDKIGVYKATNALPNKWSRLTLNSNNNIVPVPCPE